MASAKYMYGGLNHRPEQNQADKPGTRIPFLILAEQQEKWNQAIYRASVRGTGA